MSTTSKRTAPDWTFTEYGGGFDPGAGFEEAAVGFIRLTIEDARSRGPFLWHVAIDDGDKGIRMGGRSRGKARTLPAAREAAVTAARVALELQLARLGVA